MLKVYRTPGPTACLKLLQKVCLKKVEKGEQVDVVQLLKKPGALQLANSSEMKLLTNYMYYISFWFCNST